MTQERERESLKNGLETSKKFRRSFSMHLVRRVKRCLSVEDEIAAVVTVGLVC